MYCDERVVRFPVQWRGNRYFSLATLLTAANKKVGELYQEYQMQIAPLPDGNLVFKYGATDPAISFKEYTIMETLLLNYSACYEALNPYVAKPLIDLLTNGSEAVVVKGNWVLGLGA